MDVVDYGFEATSFASRLLGEKNHSKGLKFEDEKPRHIPDWPTLCSGPCCTGYLTLNGPNSCPVFSPLLSELLGKIVYVK